MRWAIIDLITKTVENVIIWDGKTNIISFENKELIKLSDDEICEIGNFYIKGYEPRFLENK